MNLDVLSFRLTRIAGRLVSTATCALTGRRVFAATGLVALGLGAAHGQTATPLLDFSNGTTGWDIHGSVAVTQGTSGVSPLPAGQDMMVISSSGGSAVAGTVEGAFGLTPNSIPAVAGFNTTNFGYATTTYTLAAGVYSFRWSFRSQDSGATYADGALFSLSGGGSDSATSLWRATSTGVVDWQTATFTIAVDGSYRLGFAAYNYGDSVNDPTLYLAGRAPAPTIATTMGDIAPSVYSTASAAYAQPTLTFGGGTLQFGADTSTNKDVVLNPGGGGIDTQAHDVTLSGDISGAGGLVKTGSGTLTLSGSNTYGGGTTVSAGTLQGDTTSLHGDITNNASLVFDQASAGTYASVISGSGDLAVRGGGSVTLSGVNTYAGGTGVASGTTLALSGGGSIANSSGVDVSGTLDIAGTTAGATVRALTGDGAVALGTKTLTLAAASGTFSGQVDGSGGLTVGGGTQTLSGINTYTGETRLAAGATLALAGAGSVAGSQRVVVDGTLDVTAAGAPVRVQALEGSGLVTLGGTTLALTTGGGDFAGEVAGTGGLHVAGGTHTLSGISRYTGATTVDAGTTLALAGTGGIAQSSRVAVEGALDLSGASTVIELKALDGAGRVHLGATNLGLDGGGTFGGVIDGSGAVQVQAGTQTFSGTNTYTGPTRVLAGATLALAGNGSIATSDSLSLAGTLDISGTTNGATVTQMFGTGTVLLGQQTLTVRNGGMPFDGILSGAGNLVVAGGMTVLNKTQAYAGTTTIAADGRLVLSDHGSVATSSGIVNDGVLDIAASGGATVHRITGSGVVLLGETLTIAQAGGTYDGQLIGTGGLRIAGGTQTFSRDNSYTGATRIDAGANVVLTGDGGLSSSGAVTVDGGLDLAATNGGTRVYNLQGGGLVALGANALYADGTAGHFTGRLSGTGGVSVSDGASLTLSGANTYSGETLVRRGASLVLVGEGSVGTSDVHNLGTIDLSGATSAVSFKSLTGAGSVALGTRTLTLQQGQGVFAGQVSGTGNLVLGGGTLVFGTDQAFAGTTTVAGGVLSVNANLAGSVAVASGGALHGSGRIAGPVTVASGGTLAPGNSPGVMSVASTVTLAPGSTFEVDVHGATAGNGAGFHDQLLVTGAGHQFVANGATLDVNLTDIAGLGTYTPYVPVLGDRYRIVVAEGGLGSTRFAPIAQPDGLAAGTRLRLVYVTGDGTTPEAIDLKVVPAALAGTAATRNTRATANALDHLIEADEDGLASTGQSRLANAVLALDAAAVDATVVALSGEIHGALAAAQPLSGQLLQGAVTKHLAMSPRSGEARLTGWADYATGETRWSADAVSSGTRSTHNQLTVGVDVWQSGASRAGVAVASTSVQVGSSAGSSGKLEDQLGVVYGQHAFAGVVGDVQLGYGTGHSRSRRADPLAPQDDALTTDLSTRQQFAAVGVRKAFDVAGTTLEPFARFGVQRVRREAGTESGSALAALGVDALSASGNRTAVGLSVTGSESDPMVSRMTFRGSLSVGHDGGDLLRPVVGTSLAGVAAGVQAPEAGRTFVAGQVFGTWLLAPGAYAYAGIGGEARSQRVQKAVAVGAAVAF